MKPRLIRLLPLAAIVLLGIELRLLFVQGVIHFDDLVYAHLARRLADGISPFTQPRPSTYVAMRIGLYGPVAAVYRLFGTSDATTLVWPFVCSILGITGAYGVGRLVYGEAAGLLAAFIFAVLPTNDAAAPALLGDGPIATLSVGVVFFLLLSSRTHGWKSAAALAGSLACLGLGLLCKPLILLVLPFFIVYVGARLRRSPLALAGAALALAGGVIGYLAYFGLRRLAVPSSLGMTLRRLALTAIDLWSQIVVGQPELSWLAPLWIVAIAALLAWHRKEARVVLLWLAATFLYGELGTQTLTTYMPIVWYDASVPARHFLFIATPAVILTGIYLAQGLKEEAARRVVIVCAVLTGIAAWVGTRGATNMNWRVTGEAPSYLPFVRISGIATILVVFGGIASPAFLGARSALVRTAGTAALVAAIGLASLQHSYLAANRYKNAWVETLPQAAQFLESQPPLPIIVQSETFGQRLDYVSHFRLGLRSLLRPFVQATRIQVGPADAAAIPESYVLVDEQYLKLSVDLEPFVAERRGRPYFFDPPARWMKINEFGKSRGGHLKIYRVSNRSPAEELTAARAALAAGRTPATFQYFLTAATAAGASCEAASAWFTWRTKAPEEVEGFDPVPMLTECYKTNQSGAGPNLFQNADFSAGLMSWTKHPDSNATVQPERGGDGVPLWHGIYRDGNWAIIFQSQVLQPDTVYVQEADVRTTAPVVSLYWESDVGRYLSLTNTYPEWTHLRYVFITPHWNGQPKSVNFHPVLLKGAGEVWLKGLRLSELGASK
jgi:hypothetical protein